MEDALVTTHILRRGGIPENDERMFNEKVMQVLKGKVEATCTNTM